MIRYPASRPRAGTDGDHSSATAVSVTSLTRTSAGAGGGVWPVVIRTASDGADSTPRRSTAATVNVAERLDESGTGTDIPRVCR